MIDQALLIAHVTYLTARIRIRRHTCRYIDRIKRSVSKFFVVFCFADCSRYVFDVLRIRIRYRSWIDICIDIAMIDLARDRYRYRCRYRARAWARALLINIAHVTVLLYFDVDHDQSGFADCSRYVFD